MRGFTFEDTVPPRRRPIAEGTVDMLEELAREWDVELTGGPRGWSMTITSRNGGSHSYSGRRLSDFVASAWAGEPGDDD